MKLTVLVYSRSDLRRRSPLTESEDFRKCRKIKLQNCSILRYYLSICATHTCLRCDKVFETAFYSLSVKT